MRKLAVSKIYEKIGPVFIYVIGLTIVLLQCRSIFAGF